MRLPAKTCYSHIGGKLGALLLEQFVAKGWLSRSPDREKPFFITEEGEREFSRLGIDLKQIKPEF